MNDIKCRDCGLTLEEDTPASLEERIPCPICGSKNRAFSVSVSSRLTVTGKATLSVKEVFSKSSLLIQAVVDIGDKTHEGELIIAVNEPWFDIIKLLQEDPDIAYKITPRKWEEIIAGAYERAGFDVVILTPHSGDLGRDIIAVKKGVGQIRIIDQVKAYKPGNLVTANDVRALMGILHEDGASKGFITTTSDFAPKIKDDPLIQPLIPSRLELINGEKLIDRLIDLSKKRD